MAGSGTAHLTGNNALLTARNLVKTFHAKGGRRVQALSDVSLELYRGETLGVVGESGSGKSVACLSVAALLPDSARITGNITLTRPSNEVFSEAIMLTTPIGSGTEKLKCELATGFTELNKAEYLSHHPL